MEFPFDVSALLADGVTLVDRSLKPLSSNPLNFRQRQAELSQVIDEIGRASAKAQTLHGPITSASKLSQSKHKLYLFKDTCSKTGEGRVVGLLKVGCKKLFVYDAHGTQHELEPLCVLDFYVHESCQRKGYGRILFEEMLMHEGVDVHHIAIDRPSSKFLSFLHKHYGLKATIPQVNNFVIFDGFFRDRPGRKTKQLNRTSMTGSLSSTGVASKPKMLTSAAPERAESQMDTSRRMRSPPHTRPPSTGASPPCAALAMGAQQAMYSRHQSSELHNVPNDTSGSPPPVRRDGPSQDYLLMVNNSNNYLEHRGGHLRLPPYYQPTSATTHTSAVSSNNPGLPPRSMQSNSTWNVFGVPPRTWSNSMANTPSIANRKYQRTSLW